MPENLVTLFYIHIPGHVFMTPCEVNHSHRRIQQPQVWQTQPLQSYRAFLGGTCFRSNLGRLVLLRDAGFWFTHQLESYGHTDRPTSSPQKHQRLYQDQRLYPDDKDQRYVSRCEFVCVFQQSSAIFSGGGEPNMWHTFFRARDPFRQPTGISFLSYSSQFVLQTLGWC